MYLLFDQVHSFFPVCLKMKIAYYTTNLDSQFDTKCIDHYENCSTLKFSKTSALLHNTWSVNVASSTSIYLKKVIEKSYLTV